MTKVYPSLGNQKASRMNDTIALKEVPSIWRMMDCNVTFAGNGALCQWPDLLPRLRGALGRVLGKSASNEALAGEPCPFNPPCAYDLFHNSQGHLEKGLGIPKPYVLRADNIKGDLRITLRLFGEACNWSGEFHAALVAAGRRGIDINKANRNELAPKNAQREIVLLRDFPTQLQSLTLNTHTPIEQRNPLNPGPHGLNIASLLTNSANRLRGLSQWHGKDLINDASTLKQLATQWGDRAQVYPARQSKSPKHRGFCGSIMFLEPDPFLILLLRLVESCHIAHGSTHGQGRFRLTA